MASRPRPTVLPVALIEVSDAMRLPSRLVQEALDGEASILDRPSQLGGPTDASDDGALGRA